MSSNFAIRARGLGKAYEIYARPIDRLKQIFAGRRRRYFDHFWALKDVEFELRPGEALGIIGRNGSGKSTLLQIICGILQPSAGRLDVAGRIAAMLELGAGFDPELTGRENVFIAATVLGLDSAQIRRRFDAIAEFAGIGEFIDRPVKHYSSGMYARLAFAVCAHVDADILVVDEVLSVGDAAFTHKCMRFIRDFMKRGTLLFVSHDMNIVVNLCSQAIWLDGGQVRARGMPKEVAHHYLASLHAERDTDGRFKFGGRTFRGASEFGSSESTSVAASVAPPAMRVDVSTPALTHGKSAKIFQFDPEAPWFGLRGASVRDIKLLGISGNVLTEVDGGEDVILRVECEATANLERPIVGFYIKDRLGQDLFGDNTEYTYRESPLRVLAGERFVAEFAFDMPYLRAGHYVINIGLAEAIEMDYVQHHWIDDAFHFQVHSSSVSRGLTGLPLRAIVLRRLVEVQPNLTGPAGGREPPPQPTVSDP